jgi:hypothetical protein
VLGVSYKTLLNKIKETGLNAPIRPESRERPGPPRA